LRSEQKKEGGIGRVSQEKVSELNAKAGSVIARHPLHLTRNKKILSTRLGASPSEGKPTGRRENRYIRDGERLEPV